MWEVYAIKYADRNARTRADSFLFDDNPTAPHPMDYFVWLLKRENEIILVDTGYDEVEAQVRGRPIRMSAIEAIEPFGIQPKDVTTIICTHLHYDHAGGITQFPNATIHLQEAEMAYVTGPCMCHGALREPFTEKHINAVIAKLFSNKLVYHSGDGTVSDGVTVHCIGGHSRGLQAVRVHTESGWMVLASDASHYYENFSQKKIFPIVVDVQSMLDGYSRLRSLAGSPKLIVPGHDPMVMTHFPQSHAPHIRRLDKGPNGDIGF